jgi:putative transposase
MKKRHSDRQIAFALQQAESGAAVEAICRKLGVFIPTFGRWKKQFAGRGAVEIRRLKQLEEENAKLKRLAADLTLDMTMLPAVLRRMYGPPRLRKPVARRVDNSPRKCIRPLASGPRLRPGHDEICARRSYKTGSGFAPAFG